MHEMSIAQNIIEIVEEEMAEHGVQEIKAVNIAIGKLAVVAVEQLAFCFSLIINDSKLAGACLNVREVPLSYRCKSCGNEFTAEDITLSCPSCGADELEMTAGRDLVVESLEV